METTGTRKAAGDLLSQLTNLTLSNGNAVARFGARLVVQYKFIDAVLPQLSAAQRKDVARLFRKGVEDVLSFTDDIAMPAEYHTELLHQVNLLLNSLEK